MRSTVGAGPHSSLGAAAFCLHRWDVVRTSQDSSGFLWGDTEADCTSMGLGVVISMRARVTRSLRESAPDPPLSQRRVTPRGHAVASRRLRSPRRSRVCRAGTPHELSVVLQLGAGEWSLSSGGVVGIRRCNRQRKEPPHRTIPLHLIISLVDYLGWNLYEWEASVGGVLDAVVVRAESVAGVDVQAGDEVRDRCKHDA